MLLEKSEPSKVYKCPLIRLLHYEPPGFNKARLMYLNVTNAALISRVKKFGQKEKNKLTSSQTLHQDIDELCYSSRAI